MPTLLTAIHDQDETPVAIHFDRNATGRLAFGAVRQTSFDVRRNRKQPPVSCGHREHHRGGLTFHYITRDGGSTRYAESRERIACNCVKVRQFQSKNGLLGPPLHAVPMACPHFLPTP